MSVGTKIFLWTFGLVQALFIVWLIAAGVSAGNEMEDLKGAEREGAEAGTALGMGLVVIVWACVDVVLGGSYAVWKLARRVVTK